MHDDDIHKEVVSTIFDQWLHYRSNEEWLMQQIVRSRGVSKSAYKRHLKETRKMIKKIERQLFNA